MPSEEGAAETSHATTPAAIECEAEWTAETVRAAWKREKSLYVERRKIMYNIKADSHIKCRAHVVPLPCRGLIHTCHAVPLPCSDSAVSFVKVRVVAGNIRTASPTV